MNTIGRIGGLRKRLRALGWSAKEIRTVWAMRREHNPAGTPVENALFDCNEWLCAWMGRISPHAAQNYLREHRVNRGAA